jgi:tetratricopeptide (TPR) repeat protein
LRFRSWLPLIILLAACAPAARAADLEEARNQFLSGRYAECLEAAEAAIKAGQYDEEWRSLKLRALLVQGRAAEAQAALQEALIRVPASVRLRFEGREVYLKNGNPQLAAAMLPEIDNLVARTPWRYTSPDNLVVLGRTALLLGADPRQVLEVFYDRARREGPNQREPYLATADLSLEMHDPALAAEVLEEALKKFPEDPDVNFGLAQAYESSDSKKAEHHLAQALKRNPRHVPSLLFQIDQLVDAERYEDADAELRKILEFNPHESRAWAYLTILAHLSHDPKSEAVYQAAALSPWSTNPEVEHLIGKKLSQKYRFAEGAAHQRRALAFDGKYLPARMQLAQDLLRLGQEAEGWQLAAEGFERNGYDVAAFNLMELRDSLAKFRTLEDAHFVVRMDAKEAEVYGDRVLALLNRARQTLCTKYGWELTQPITVEIFPKPADFAVRTFGMPGGSGYLGVCFGKVITANSPASQAEHPANWESVLWHEFCHVVTLELTHNKLPRWLSEGISVYEERQADPAWGQELTPRYRKWILDGELTPIGKLSGAFLSPPSPMHLQFAYFESALAVEFLIERFGFETLQKILHDLGAGLPINAALDRHTAGLESLEQEFAEFARHKAEQWAPDADWEQPDFSAEMLRDGQALAAWVKERPQNFYGLQAYCRLLVSEKNWEAAVPQLQRFIALCPRYAGPHNGYVLLAQAYRELGQKQRERRTLEELTALDAAETAAGLRLLELAADAEDWQAARKHAERLLAINPLIAPPHRALAEAAEKLDDRSAAIRGYSAWLTLDPVDQAEVHYRLARLLHGLDDRSAKRHVLQALEAAPRFRAAHRLLLEIQPPENPARRGAD